jgi:hypothetical protein
MFARSATDIIPRTRQEVGAKKTLIKVFFTAKKPIVLAVFRRDSIFNQLYFINNIFPDFKTVNLICQRQKIGLTLWVHMKNSMCHNGSKVMSKIQKNRISRMPHPPYS